jgi:hypothetical protein
MEAAAARTVGTLRGAAVEADGRLVTRVALAVCAGALLVAVIVLTVAGFAKNAQVTALRTRGVVVEVHATGCTGLMGGSGSNLAGYRCAGWFALGGRRYVGTIPDDALHRPGAIVRAITVPGDPALLATVAHVATARPSPRVFLVPGVLAVIVLVGGAALVARHRRLDAGSWRRF